MLKNIQPNYIHYPFGVQESLALDVPVRIQSDDPVYSFLEAIERINLAKYFAPVRSNNSSSHDRVMLLRVILFSYMTSRKNISLRELESLCRTDCRFLYLSNYEMPSHQAFKRVLDILQEGAIDDIFFELSHHIAVDLMCIDLTLE
ncbi:transposase [Faecalibaculum rodentium]|uniref:transposase n=1 Tax=Faecalibaculum rodentium TaxID=1702221 RepID=UPI00266F40D7|nr:transposase [Faecalibaculum rodentium]